MERLIITNGKLILPTGIKMGQTLICENGKIEQIIPNGSYQPLVGDKVIDARQNYVSPGFIDMHIHGGGGHDFMDGTIEAFLGVAETHAKYGGAQAWLPERDSICRRQSRKTACRT